ncbi:Dabb family protein [Croceitalea rosinachiae]|uniref:Dabb family protein n=1 Tax=Croceitalea rosinachiae TaxID=3075596 RepID=A0ABU3ADG5_9FLAO|nr:Dabb family protein [Croceitalea sp. F388]MDT0608230.1 Dabb family protein [Croceitalea sp. F388]
MKKNTLFIFTVAAAICVSFAFMTFNDSNSSEASESIKQQESDSLLRHVVLFKFKDETSVEKLKEIEDAFNALPSKIKEIQDYEWGLNNSPEGLNKGLTHCFFVTFKTEADRAIYLPHSDHKAFVEVASPYIEDVTVVDYWTK